MLSESELVARLREILQSSDLNTTTPGTVRRQLETDFGVDLSDRKRFIGQQIDEYLESHVVKNEDADDEEDETAKGGEGEDGDDQEEDVDDDEEADKVVPKKRSRKKRSSDEATPKKKRGGGGFTKVCSLSPQLHEFLGTAELARTEVVKRLWNYIRENELQDPNNRRIIRCDEKFRPIFNVERIDMFQMNKALSKHIWPLEGEVSVSSASSSATEKRNKQGKEDEDEPKTKTKEQKGGSSDEDEPKVKPKNKKGGNSGLAAPIPLSEALIKFLGTGETQLSRSDVIKRMWDYFKKNELQDPSDKRMILCDDKLKELLDVESFRGFSVAKLLSSHFIKAE